MLGYGDLMFKLGLVDDNARNTIQDMETETMKLLKTGNSLAAIKKHHDMLEFFSFTSKFNNYYNILHECDPLYESEKKLSAFVKRSDVRRAIHVGDTAYVIDSDYILNKMLPDFMNSVRPWVEELLDNDYRVVCYSGQLDIIVAYPLSVRFYQEMQFRGSDEYRDARRTPWYVGDRLAGYVKSGGNFTEVLVRNSGHMVPVDQPEWAFDLINRITDRRL